MAESVVRAKERIELRATAREKHRRGDRNAEDQKLLRLSPAQENAPPRDASAALVL